MYIISYGVLCGSEDSFVGGHVDFSSDFACSIRLYLDHSVRETTVRVLKV